jgi:hypothetical protein
LVDGYGSGSESLEESYHQKIKEDTNYLARQRKQAEENHMSFDRKESETMYSLKIRQSYTANPNSHQSRQIMGGLDDSIKEFDMEIEDECLEFIPPEHFDSD